MLLAHETPPPSLAIVASAYNLADHVGPALDRLDRAVQDRPPHTTRVFLCDDGSTDGTAEAMLEAAGHLSFPIRFFSNPENRGLVATLKAMYRTVLGMPGRGPDYVLKLDLDADYPQDTALEQMERVSRSGANIAVGMRVRDIRPEEHPYEHERREALLDVIDSHPRMPDLDPASIGVQLYERETLAELLGQRVVRTYRERWGLAFLMALVAAHLGYQVHVEPLAHAAYHPERRPFDKVQAQYDAYHQIIRRVTRTFTTPR